MNFELKVIGHVRSKFSDKFGIPRQSGMADLPAEIIFLPEYRNPDAFRGLDGFSHIWILWQFSESVRDSWSPTVRPPRLGGNKRMGVFATRSPFRPNSIGLSSVKLERIEISSNKGPVLHISGADILDGTPVFDIKPYLAFTDCHPHAADGFAGSYKDYQLKVDFPLELKNKLPENLKTGVTDILAGDPRPSYQDDPDRVYGMDIADFSIKFKVDGGVLTVTDVEKLK